MRRVKYTNKSVLLCLLYLSMLLVSSLVDATEKHVSLKRFLNARMFGEAYMEILREEIKTDEIDPTLQNIKRDILQHTFNYMQRQLKVNSTDSAVHTILADINFQKNEFDQAIKHITAALKSKPTPLTHYIFSKILFRRGNISQAFSQMTKVFENMPDSKVVFADFQFLYSCNSFGLRNAIKISENTNFLKRATPITEKGSLSKVPQSPFENDPTVPSDTPKESDPNDEWLSLVETWIDTELLSNVDEQDSLEKEFELVDNTQKQQDPDEPDSDPLSFAAGLPDLPEVADLDDFVDIDFPTPLKKEPIPDLFDDILDDTLDDAFDDTEIVIDELAEENQKKALLFINNAQTYYDNKNYDEAKKHAKKALDLEPSLSKASALLKDSEAKLTLIEQYWEAYKDYNADKFDKALPIISQAFAEMPEIDINIEYVLARTYLLKKEPEYDKALSILDSLIAQPERYKASMKDIKWTKLETLNEMADYESALSLLQEFMFYDRTYAKNQPNFQRLYYGIWYGRYKLQLFLFLFFVLALFGVVLVLRVLPVAISMLFLKDPLAKAKEAFEKEKYDKVIEIIENAVKKNQPLPVLEKMLELNTKAHFELKNYLKCQETAKQLLERFYDNQLAPEYIAKSNLATNNTSSEAISMYETLHKENPDDIRYLSILAKHYANTSNFSSQAINMMLAYYRTGNNEAEILPALADAYVNNKTMDEAVIEILEKALQNESKSSHRELLARNYARVNRFSDSVRECILLLNENIDNMGIHVVYTSSMKKLKMIDEAIEQYEGFLKQYPNNLQLKEILSGLQRDAADFSFDTDDEDGLLPDTPQSLTESELIFDESMTAGQDSGEIDIENFVEPPPEGYKGEDTTVPIPDFMREEYSLDDNIEPLIEKSEEVLEDESPDVSSTDSFVSPHENSAPETQDEIPTLDPFGDEVDFINEYAAELPEELGGTLGDDAIEQNTPQDVPQPPEPPEPPEPPLPSVPVPVSPPQPSQPSDSKINIGHKLILAKDLFEKNEYDKAVEMLNPIFATDRNEKVGIFLASCYLAKDDPLMAMEIIETVDFDMEIMNENVKEILYNIAIALENTLNFEQALKMYDTICNADINYKDVFDRSDKLYSKK